MVVERELARTGNASPPRDGPRGLRRQGLGVEGGSRAAPSSSSRAASATASTSSRNASPCRAPRRPGEEGNFHDAVLKTFVDFYDRGLIFRGKRLVNWDPHFETAISDLEVEQVETKGHLWRLRYPLEDGATYEHPVAFDDDGKPTAFETRDYLVVATTRPETMLGDTGVAVHPDDARYRHLVGKTVRLPLVGRSIPIVADAYADPAKGTGAVKITPAHDFNDWAVGQRAGLAAINVMDTRARIALEGQPRLLGGRRPRRRARRPRRPRPLRGARADRHPRRGAGLARRHRRRDPHRPARRPLQGRDRAVPHRPVVRRRRQARRPGPRRRPRGPHPHPAREPGEDLLPLAREHRALVHLPPALVGAPDPGLVRATRRGRRSPDTHW